MKVLIRKAIVDASGIHRFSDTGIVGQIRIWIADTDTPTDYWLLFQDDGNPLSIDSNIDNQDFNNQFGPQIQKIFDAAKSKLLDYGISKNRGFHMDIKVPLSLVKKYKLRLG